MRPVKRGAVPTDSTGAPKTVADYKDWRLDLLIRLDGFCCYCDIPNDCPQVEHIAPKDSPLATPWRLLAWDNMLLSYASCNQIKGATECDVSTHFLPHYHNTQLAFSHRVVRHPKNKARFACIVIPAPTLAGNALAKAQATIRLCGLDKTHHTNRQFRRATDPRWHKRFDALLLAHRYYSKWKSLSPNLYSEFLDCLNDLIYYTGFFSIWFEVFSTEPRVLAMLTNAFKGTEHSCFSLPSYTLTVRVVGDL